VKTAANDVRLAEGVLTRAFQTRKRAEGVLTLLINN